MSENRGNQIAEKLAVWDMKKEMSDFIKERLGMEDKHTGKTHAEDIVDNAITRAKIEEDPKWTPLLLNAVQPKEEKNTGTQVNIFQHLADPTKERMDELINVTPKKDSIIKKGIEEII